jgi:hypothetical protein
MAAYTRPLQRKLQEAGLQGVVEADAFQVLLKYVADTEGDLDSLYRLLESLKQGKSPTQAGSPIQSKGVFHYRRCCCIDTQMRTSPRA